MTANKEEPLAKFTFDGHNIVVLPPKVVICCKDMKIKVRTTPDD